MITSNIKAIIPCEIQKVWETVFAFDRYPAWRSNVSKTEVTDEKHFTEHTKSDYSTTYTVTAVEPHQRLELDVENSSTKGHWTLVFTAKGDETELDFTADVTAKQLSMRPIGKSFLEQKYVKKEQTQYINDLQKSLG